MVRKKTPHCLGCEYGIRLFEPGGHTSGYDCRLDKSTSSYTCPFIERQSKRRNETDLIKESK